MKATLQTPASSAQARQMLARFFTMQAHLLADHLSAEPIDDPAIRQLIGSLARTLSAIDAELAPLNSSPSDNGEAK